MLIVVMQDKQSRLDNLFIREEREAALAAAAALTVAVAKY